MKSLMLRTLPTRRVLYRRCAVPFPNLQFTVEDLIAEGDKVVTRFQFVVTHQSEFMGVAGSDKAVALTGMWIHRLENGRIVEGRQWGQWDALGFL